MTTKEAAYRLLTERRKSFRFEGLLNPSEIEEGRYDADHVELWARWMGNLNAKILLVGKDFGGKTFFLKFQGGCDPNSTTNRNLMQLFSSLGIDIGWAGTLHYTAVALRSGKGIERPKNVALHNTLYDVGNTILTCSGPDSIVEYNHVHHGGLISSDVSLLYTSMPAADGLEFHYNWVHDSLSPNHSLGIRGDDETRGLRVHHSVVWNVAKDGIVTKGGRNRVYNNTCLANGASDIMFNSGPEPDKWWQKHVKAYQNQNEDSLLVNNCASSIVSTRRRTQPPLPGDHSNNYTDGKPMLVDPGQFDFRPQAGSPLVDAGRAVDGVTAAYEGAAPDVGAYEYGGEHWLPGHRNGVWLAGKDGVFAVRLSLPIVEPIQVRVAQNGKQITTLEFTPQNWSSFQRLSLTPSGNGAVTFEEAEWGRAAIPSLTETERLVDVRATFARPDIASARIVDSRPKYDYEYRYDAGPVVLPTWRAYFTDKAPAVDGSVEDVEPLPEGSVARVNEGPYQEGCMRLHADDAEAMKKRVIKWTYPVGEQVTAPGRYCLSYHVRVVGEGLVPHQDIGSFNSYLRIEKTGSQGENLGQRPSMLTTTHDRWIRREVIVDVPAGAKPTMISLQLHQATGTVLLDDVSLLRCAE